MNYEIITSRWLCPECSSPIRLHFSQLLGADDEPSEEFVFDRAFCGMGHVLPDELWDEIRPGADEEFTAAFERGSKVSEIWCAPQSENESPNDMPPPEE